MQKQEAVILSAQFSGFLKLVEGLSSEKISELMNKTHSIIENTIKLHQGKIIQFTGEKLLVVFNGAGSKLSHAVETALEIKSHLKDFIENEKLNGDFGLKIGHAYGEIVATEFGSSDSKQSTIMGEAVSNANRICEFAGVDQILVDGNIFNSTEKQFKYQSLEPIPIKGTDETLPIFELTGKNRKKLELKTKSERKIVSEMVGRTREAEQLEGLIKNLVNGKGTIVNIVGKAGIGKSRLVDEMKVQPIMEKVLLLEGRAVSTGQNLSFHPITNLIKSWAGILEDDIPSISSEKLYQGIKRNTPEQADEIYSFNSLVKFF
jgi:class 3 adenylate cyclase